MTTPADSRDIRLTRVYDAPVSRVWSAWTDAAQVAQWWGPRGFTITTHSRDLTEGGTWVYTMHGPDGTDYPNFTRYLVVEPHVRLVYDHGATSADTAPMFRVTAEFTDLGDRTQLDLCMTLATPEDAARTRVFIKAAGGNATWDRLAEHLEHTTHQREIFVINRSFPAPVHTLFDLWATPAHLAAWLPPRGFTMTFSDVELRTGGHGVWSMTNGEFTMYGRMQYRLVERPTRIEYTQCFTDAEGNVSRHPGMPTWPESMHTLVTFTAEGDHDTRVTVRWSVDGHATADELAAFVAERRGMTQGWTGSFDKLEALVEALPANTAAGALS